MNDYDKALDRIEKVLNRPIFDDQEVFTRFLKYICTFNPTIKSKNNTTINNNKDN